MFRPALLNVEDYRREAQRRLPRMVFDFLEGGADRELGLAHNRAVFDRLRFRPRRLTDVSRRDLSVQLFGERQKLPLVVGPTGLNGLLWPRGDIALARAAAKAGIPFVLSSAATTSIEEMARSSDGPLWFQLYVVHRLLAEQLVRRALAAGYQTLVLTTDVIVNGYRERDFRNGFTMPLRYTPRAVLDFARHPSWALGLRRGGALALANFADADVSNLEVQAALMSRNMDASFDWAALDWLRQLWPHRLLVKGILAPEDALRCAAAGVDGVILSNHGGRQLDSCISPMETLAATAALGRPVLIDSGFRCGADIVKALALGAQAVLLGRATLYGLAAAGEAGAADVLRLLQADIDRTLVQIGRASIAELSPDDLVSG